jgi:hypothetical protein
MGIARIDLRRLRATAIVEAIAVLCDEFECSPISLTCFRTSFPRHKRTGSSSSLQRIANATDCHSMVGSQCAATRAGDAFRPATKNQMGRVSILGGEKAVELRSSQLMNWPELFGAGHDFLPPTLGNNDMIDTKIQARDKVESQGKSLRRFRINTTATPTGRRSIASQSVQSQSSVKSAIADIALIGAALHSEHFCASS